MTDDRNRLNRRQVLKAGAAAAILCMGPLPALARYNLTAVEYRTLSLYNTHTGEALRRITYWERGDYLAPALEEINHLLRDHRADAVGAMDPAVVDQMFALYDMFDCDCAIEIISGYRSPHTNAMLRKQSGGVAKRSYHMQGKAIDLRIPDVPLGTLRKAAIRRQKGGVGYYPESDFIHIDSGPVRTW